MAKAKRPGIYRAILERIFFSRYEEGMDRVEFKREDINRTGIKLGVDPKNLGDLVYSFRFRATMPEKIRATAPEGLAWIIRIKGRSMYSFELIADRPIVPNDMLVEIKVPDSSPGIVTKYALSDEQALLAKLRYNRLIDTFTGVTCYSLQNHLRTTVPSLGGTQVETDELYVGLDKTGVHYVFPVEAKGGSDKLSIVQIEQDIALCGDKFPKLVCRAIGAQFVEEKVIALFEFQISDGRVKVSREKHYRLVPPEDVTEEDLEAYKAMLTGESGDRD